MARSIWSGTISFGLISIPVKLFTAVRHKGVSFNQLDDRAMGRIRYEKVSEADGEVVPAEHIVKGVEISKGRYVVVDPDELAPFVPLATSSRQYTAALRADEGRLTMSTLAYADELVPAAEVEELAGLDAVEVSDREVKMAEMLVESLTAAFDPTKYEDDYRVQVLDLIAKKAAGEEFELPAAAGEPPKIVGMMAALEASVAAAKEARKRHPTALPGDGGQEGCRQAPSPTQDGVAPECRRDAEV
jgi:DNA end-binding protein Ku